MSHTPPPRTDATAPSWDDLLGAEAAREREAADVVTRREAREREAAHAAGRVRSRSRDVSTESFGFPSSEPPRRRRRWIGWIVAPLVVVLLIGGGGIGAAFLIMPDWPSRLESLMAGPETLDYEGSGNGTVDVVIREGDIGSDVAVTLQQAGVTKTFESFYNLLLAEPSPPVFQPGTYRLKAEMSARAALIALLDPANKLQNEVLVVEGERVSDALPTIAAGTQLPLDQLQAAAADVASFGLPAGALSLEGFLFPATYQFQPGVTPHDALQQMVDRMRQELDRLGVPEADRVRVVTLASIVQREAGSIQDMPMIARVFQNRLDQGMPLQSDATVHYGTGKSGTVWTTDADRADASNPYNTYANPGLPVGPIGSPGADAIAAAMNPVPGDWLYFVTVNLETGETVFSNSLGEHEAAVSRLREWCSASDANAAYCG
ncbi:endolytic transglycosylase MltG [Naasia sp. SYSU D00948]|uniref:endolytic transglycosylase MltG n=1 Tax=Naasia sp. SYSU D00948 TaxID=2817379 RepID=UPI001FED2BB2|nr:endolytic transglycosylase MltG [Naasia sp. SYSU D00948]